MEAGGGEEHRRETGSSKRAGIRPKCTGQSGAGQPAETALASRAPAGGGGGRLGGVQRARRPKSAKGEMGEGSPRRPRGRSGRKKGGKTERSAKYEAICGPKGGEGKGYEQLSSRTPSRTMRNAASRRR